MNRPFNRCNSQALSTLTCVLDKRYDSQSIKDTRLLSNLSQAFLNSGFVKLPGLLKEFVFQTLSENVDQLIPHVRYHNFLMPGCNTPRVMGTVGGTSISRYSPFISSLYQHEQILELLKRLTGREVYRCQHEEEFVVVNYQRGVGETHGWHFDDPDLALVVVIRAPSRGGGNLEFIPPPNGGGAWKGDRSEDVLAFEGAYKGRIITARFAAKDAYLLYASKYLHRVAPLRVGEERAAVCMAFSFSSDQTFGSSADILYRKVQASPASDDVIGTKRAG